MEKLQRQKGRSGRRARRSWVRWLKSPPPTLPSYDPTSIPALPSLSFPRVVTIPESLEIAPPSPGLLPADPKSSIFFSLSQSAMYRFSCWVSFERFCPLYRLKKAGSCEHRTEKCFPWLLSFLSFFLNDLQKSFVQLSFKLKKRS